MVALFSFSDMLKPLYGILFDSKRFSSLQARKRVIVAIQCILISIFALSMTVEFPNRRHLAALFAMSNVLTSLHDTAVDGLAVHFLKPTEQPFGAFGQYAGYKAGTLFMGGILPAYVGTNHKILCKGIIALFPGLILRL